ncbi:MAG: thiopeptide-type bacteriocin biosynthesis protein [Nannocystaceae bacterium]
MSTSSSASASPRPGATRWIQLNTAPTRRDGSRLAAERELLAALAGAFAAARARGLSCAWVLHKDPGLRIRLGGVDLDPQVEPELAALLEDLGRRGVIEGFSTSIYEPERHLFGGDEAMDAVHRFFDADTAAMIAWEGLQVGPAARPRIAPAVLALAVVHELFRRCLVVREEVWDVWCNVAELYRGYPGATPDLPLVGLAEAHALAGPALAPIVAIYDPAIAELAAAFDRLWRSGRLSAGRRAILPFVAAFTWNRLRIAPETIAALARGMVRAADPRAGLRGFDPEAPLELAAQEVG